MQKSVLSLKRLKVGDSVRIIAPSSSFEKKLLYKGVGKLSAMGLKVVFRKDIFKSDSYFSGTVKRRLNELNEAFLDKECKAIFCARGGFGASLLLSSLNSRIIRSNPKLLMGFSDLTALLIHLYDKFGLKSIHGPLIASRKFLDSSRRADKYLEELIFKSGKIEYDIFKGSEVITKGKTRGILYGGNLCVLTSLLGTPFAPNFKNKILFLEDVSEAPYRIERMLWQLESAGVLKDARGFLVGKFTDKTGKIKSSEKRVIKEIFVKYIKPLNRPAIFGFPIGHHFDNIPLPLGAMASLDTSRGLKSEALCV